MSGKAIVPAVWADNVWIIAGLSAIDLGFAVASIVVRMRDRSRRFLLKRSERAEGIYIVPHSPILAAACIALYNLLTILDASLLHGYWTASRHSLAVRTLNPILPLPIWAWVWISAFSPIYAVHLFPPAIVSEVTSPFIARLVRFKPNVVNFACYGVPAVVGVVQLTFCCIWPNLLENGIRHGIEKDVCRGFILYRLIWALWALIFSTTSTIYVAYSLVLIRVLGTQLSELDGIEKAQRNLSMQFAQQAEAPIAAPLPGAISSAGAVHEITTYAKVSPKIGALESNCDSESAPVARKWRRRASAWLASPSATNSHRDFHRELGKYSKMELLRLNTRLIISEAVIFSVFLYTYCAFILFRVVQGVQVIARPRPVAIVILLQLYIGTIFALLSAILLYWKGRNVAQTRVAMSPVIPKVSPLRAFLQRLTPRVPFPDSPDISPKTPQFTIEIDVDVDEEKLAKMEATDEVATLAFRQQRVPPPEISPDPSIKSASTKSEEVGKSDWRVPVEWTDPPVQQPVKASIRRASTLAGKITF